MDVLKANQYILRKLKNELPSKLTYHTFRHSIDVVRFAELLAVAEGVTGEDLVLVQTAAAYHDSGFLIQYNKNEPIGCEIAKRELPQFGYNETQINTICDIIIATQIPQSPKNLLAQVVCDSDLDYLGTEDFYYQGNCLRKELATQDVTFSERQWLELEIGFMEKHSYFTKTSKMLRDDVKATYVSELKEKLKTL